jgi:hypothetical protein
VVLRSRFATWVLVGLTLTACSSPDEQPRAQGSSGTSGKKGTGGTQNAGSSGAGASVAAGKGGGGAGAGATSRGGSGDVSGDGGSDAPSSGGMSASGKGGSISVSAGGSGNAGGTQNVAGAGSGSESEGGDGASSPLDACLGEPLHLAFPPPCATAVVPLDEEVAPCEFALPTPSGVPLVFGNVSVAYASDLGTTFVPAVSGPSVCDEAPGSGFYFSADVEPYSIVLCPCTCAAVAAGAGELDAVYGCPTIEL